MRKATARTPSSEGMWKALEAGAELLAAASDDTGIAGISVLDTAVPHSLPEWAVVSTLRMKGRLPVC